MLCGDFNSTPEFGVYKLMTEGVIPKDYADWRSSKFSYYNILLNFILIFNQIYKLNINIQFFFIKMKMKLLVTWQLITAWRLPVHVAVPNTQTSQRDLQTVWTTFFTKLTI